MKGRDFRSQMLHAWMSRELSKWLENWLFHLLLNAVYWGYNPLILIFDPNFLGHPSGHIYLHEWLQMMV